MILNDFIRQYPAMHNIKRFSMECVLSPQDLANHSYGTGTIFYLICKELDYEITVDELFVAMNHDFVESFTGDLNIRVKKEVEASWSVIENTITPNHLRELTEKQIKSSYSDIFNDILTVSDALEAFLYCSMEVGKGNSYLKNARQYYMSKCKRIVSTHIHNERINLSSNALNWDSLKIKLDLLEEVQ